MRASMAAISLRPTPSGMTVVRSLTLRTVRRAFQLGVETRFDLSVN
jgi:hypothetical protein